jgi:hypothetical protein
MHPDYHISDDLIYCLAKLGLHEMKTVYTATALHAWHCNNNPRTTVWKR